MPTRGQLKQQQLKREAASEGKELKEVAEKPPVVEASESAPFNRNKTDKLRYPLKDRGLYQGQVRFRVRELEPLTTSQLSNLNFVEELLNSDKLSKLDDKIDKDNTDASPEEKQKRIEIKNKEYQILKGNQNQTYENPAAQRKYAGSVTLYLPPSLQITDTVEYNANVALGTIGAGVESGLQGGASALDAVGAGLTQGISSFTDLFSGGAIDREASALALTRASESFGPQEVAAGVKSATRVAVNPNLRTLLGSVPIREIPFTFRLVARSKDEAIEIEKIIKFFRYQLYPDEISGQIGGAQVSLGYKFPDPFEISTTYKGKQVGTKFLDAYLRSVAVTYNETSTAFHSDGYPTDISMSLSFIESKALTRKLVEEGY